MELLNKLQETQKKERDAYGLLETAMIDTAIPKKQRIHQNASLTMNINDENKHGSMPSLKNGKKNDQTIFDKYQPLPVGKQKRA